MDESSSQHEIRDGYRSLIKELLEALEGVVKVADRDTLEFDRARAAIAKARGQD